MQCNKCEFGEIEIKVDVSGEAHFNIAFKLVGMCNETETIKFDGDNKRKKENTEDGELEELEY